MAEKRRFTPRDEKARTDFPPDLSDSLRKEKRPINAPVRQVRISHAHLPKAHERENHSVQKP
jgi:hypothetical protein